MFTCDGVTSPPQLQQVLDETQQEYSESFLEQGHIIVAWGDKGVAPQASTLRKLFETVIFIQWDYQEDFIAIRFGRPESCVWGNLDCVLEAVGEVIWLVLVIGCYVFTEMSRFIG